MPRVSLDPSLGAQGAVVPALVGGVPLLLQVLLLIFLLIAALYTLQINDSPATENVVIGRLGVLGLVLVITAIAIFSIIANLRG